jgi:hypothetical protein
LLLIHTLIFMSGLKSTSMFSTKSDVISRLKREILPLEGLRATRPESARGLGLDFTSVALPQGSLPLGAVHELISEGAESALASIGFIAGLLGGLMKNGGAAVWIGNAPTLFPPGTQNLLHQSRPGHLHRPEKRKGPALGHGRSSQMFGPPCSYRRNTGTQLYPFPPVPARSRTVKNNRIHPPQ